MWDSYPLGGREWILDYYKDIGLTLSAYAKEKMGGPVHLSHGYPYTGMALKAYSIVWEHGALGPAGEMWNGGCGGRGECDLEAAADWHHEHGCHMSFSIEDRIQEFGSLAEIEEAEKAHVLKHKHMPRFGPAICPPFWTPLEKYEAAIKAAKKYGRYE